MAQVIWSGPALRDLDEIADYIALDKVSAAEKLVKNVFLAVKRLENFPKSGRKPPELDALDFRELLVGPCRIFYQIKNVDEVHILYIMRSERDLRKYMLTDRTDRTDRTDCQVMEDK